MHLTMIAHPPPRDTADGRAQMVGGVNALALVGGAYLNAHEPSGVDLVEVLHLVLVLLVPGHSLTSTSTRGGLLFALYVVIVG